MTYRTAPKRRAAQKWHKLLDNGYRVALIDDTDKVILAARYAWELAAQHRQRPTLQQITITLTRSPPIERAFLCLLSTGDRLPVVVGPRACRRAPAEELRSGPRARKQPRPHVCRLSEALPVALPELRSGQQRATGRRSMPCRSHYRPDITPANSHRRGQYRPLCRSFSPCFLPDLPAVGWLFRSFPACFDPVLCLIWGRYEPSQQGRRAREQPRQQNKAGETRAKARSNA